MILEMFLWTKPLGLKAFKLSPQKAIDSKQLAMNQGLYNGFLAAGLIFGLLTNNSQVSAAFILFFLSCVIVAGVFGAFTVAKKIFYIQALPAILAILFFLLGNSLKV